MEEKSIRESIEFFENYQGIIYSREVLKNNIKYLLAPKKKFISSLSDLNGFAEEVLWGFYEKDFPKRKEGAIYELPNFSKLEIYGDGLYGKIFFPKYSLSEKMGNIETLISEHTVKTNCFLLKKSRQLLNEIGIENPIKKYPKIKIVKSEKNSTNYSFHFDAIFYPNESLMKKALKEETFHGKPSVLLDNFIKSIATNENGKHNL